MYVVLTWILVYLTVVKGNAFSDENITETVSPDSFRLLSPVDLPTLDPPSMTRFGNFGQYMEQESTQQFISSFSTYFERLLVAKQLEYCPLEPLCSFSLNLTDSPRHGSCCGNCSCGPECLQHNNCCPDKVVTYRESTDTPVKRCLPLRLNTNLMESPFDLWSAMHITSCPAASGKTASMLCERDYNAEGTTLSDVVPVVNKVTGEVYRNVHCAACNNVVREGLEFFEATLGCKDIFTITEVEMMSVKTVLLSTNCDIQFSKSSYVKHCSTAISECNVTGKWMIFDEDYITACKLYTSKVEDSEGNTYSNIFCALCNGVSDLPHECFIRPRYPPRFKLPYPYTALLSITPSDERKTYPKMPEDEIVSQAGCASSQIYSEILDDCVDVECSPLRTLQNGTCERQVQEYDSNYYQIKIRLQPVSFLSLRAAYSELNEVLLQLRNAVRLKDRRLRLDFCVPDVLLKTDMNVNEPVTEDLMNGINIEAYYIKVKAHIQGKHDPEHILELVKLPDFVESGVALVVFSVTVIDGYDDDFDVVSSLVQSRHTPPDFNVPLKPLESMISNAFVT